MANYTKYTGSIAFATIGNLASQANYVGAYFWAEDPKGTNAGVLNMGTSTAKVFIAGPNATKIEPSSISNLPSGTTYVNLDVNAQALWSNGQLSNIATNTVEVRQRANINTDRKASWVWNNSTTTVSYTFTQVPYNKAVKISAGTGAVTSTEKAASKSASSVTVTGAKKGTTTFTFTPSDGQTTASTTVECRQKVDKVNISDGTSNITDATVNSGASLTVYVGVSANNPNEADEATATANIYSAKVTQSNTCGATCSVSSTFTASKAVTPTSSTGTAVTLSNITESGKFTVTSDQAPSNVIGELTITVGSITISLYGDSSCSKAKSAADFNPGDSFYVKVTGGTGNGTLSCNTSDVTIGTASISSDGGVSKVTTANTVASDITLTFTPANGTAITKEVTYKAVTVTLS